MSSNRGRFAAAAVAVLLLAGLVLPSATCAQEATVRLTNGGFVRGEIIELEPSQRVRIRMADGAVREIAWPEIADIEEATGPAVTPSAGAMPAAATPPPPLSPEHRLQIAALVAEREAIDNTAAGVMMVGGGAAVVIIGLPGLVLLLAGEVCPDATGVAPNDPGVECTDVATAGAVMTVIGVAGGVIGVWGLVKLIDNDKRRSALDARIAELQLSAAPVFDLRSRPSGAALTLTGRF